jgi:hypothetical protein
MFIIKVTYIKPIEEVDKYLLTHREFLGLPLQAGAISRIWPNESKNRRHYNRYN